MIAAGSSEGTGDTAAGKSAAGGPAPLRLLIAFSVVVAVVVALTFWPVLTSKALFSDDFLYIVQNETVRHPSWSAVVRFFSEVTEPTTVPGYYEPWSMVSLMLDCAMGGSGRNLVPFHRTCLCLHVMNTLLLIAIVYLLFGKPWAAAAAGLLYGLHPLHVESVAWVSQRKTLLGTFFAFWCLVFYVQYARRGSRWAYAASLAACVMALTSKPTTLPLPILMLLLDYWPLRRLGRRAIIEKIPFLVLAGVSGVITLVALERTAYLDTPGEVGPARIALIVSHNVVFYLRKVFWPTGLSAWYPYPDPLAWSHPAVRIGVVGTCVLAVGLLVSLRWTRALLTGWLLFFVGIFPAMGAFKVTPAIAADRYVYLPLLGFAVTLGWVLSRAWPTVGWLSRPRRGQVVVAALVVAAAVALGAGARDYLVLWQDKERIFRRMVAFGPDQPWLHNGLANALIERGRIDEAILHYREVARLSPDAHRVRDTLAGLLARRGRLDLAVAYYQESLRLAPEEAGTHVGLAEVLARLGRFNESADHYTAALKIDPNRPEAHHNLAVALVKLGKLDAAVEHYTEAIRLKPDFAAGYWNLGAALIKQGKLDEAVEVYRRAARLRPTDPDAHYRLGLALSRAGRLDEARACYREVLRLDPFHAGARRCLSGGAIGGAP